MRTAEKILTPSTMKTASFAEEIQVMKSIIINLDRRVTQQEN